MTTTAPPDEEPLDPQAAAVFSKVKRIMGISMALTGLAIAGVFILIGYRVSQSGKPPAETAAITLPAGARVVSTAVSADRIAVTVEAGGRTEVLLYDLYTLQPRGKLSIGAP